MEIKNGVVCFTFDDRNFGGWVDALPLFERYGAHASFFVSGKMDDAALSAIRKLNAAGHTVGLHSENHKDAPAYFERYGADAYFKNEIEPELMTLRENGIPVSAFAYPNNRRTKETDESLGTYFKRFRAGNSTSEKKFFPVSDLAEERVMPGFGVGEYYHTVEEEMLDKIRLCAKENLCMTFFSHNIAENAVHIHFPKDLLEKCLATANKNGVLVLGLDELP